MGHTVVSSPLEEGEDLEEVPGVDDKGWQCRVQGSSYWSVRSWSSRWVINNR